MKADPTEPVASTEALRSLAELLGGLLLREVESTDLMALREPALATSLVELGIELPPPSDETDWLEQRGAEYHDLLLRPEAGPPVQSLWTQGRYEGDPAVRVRQLAEAAGVEFHRTAARGAAVDHLGSLFLLWSATCERSPAISDEVAREHLGWSGPPLQRIAAVGGFYGAVAEASGALIEMLRELAERRDGS